METRVNVTRELLCKLRCLCTAARATRKDFRCSGLVHLEDGLAEITDGVVLVFVRDEALSGLPAVSVKADHLSWALRLAGGSGPTHMEIRADSLAFLFASGGVVEIPLIRMAWPLTRKYMAERLAPVPVRAAVAIHPRYVRVLAAFAPLREAVLRIGVGEEKNPVLFASDGRRIEAWVMPLNPEFANGANAPAISSGVTSELPSAIDRLGSSVDWIPRRRA